MQTQSSRTRLAIVAVAVAAVLTAAACGTRVPRTAVLAAEQGALVTVSPGQNVVGDAGSAPSGSSAGGTDLKTGTAASGAATGGGAGTGGGGGSGGGANNVSGGGGGGSGGGTSGGGQSGGAACTAQGAPLVIGQVTTASGIIGPEMGSSATVSQVWARWVNAQGGIACHPVQVLTRDDTSDPSKSQSQVNDLVKTNHVQALLAAFVPISIAGFKTAVDQTNIPVVGGDLFADAWWNDANFYPVGTDVVANAYGATAAVVTRTGHKKVAVVYCIEAPICPPYSDSIKANIPKVGGKVVYATQVTMTSPDYTSVCQNAKNAGANVIAMIIDGSAVSRVARACHTIGLDVPLAVASLGATFAPTDQNVQRDTITLASAVAPWFSSVTKGQQEFQQAMHQYAPSFPLDPASVLAWADGMMLKTAIEALGPSARTQPITTAVIRKALARVKNETLDGLVAPTTFNAGGGANPKNPCYYPVTFGAGGKYRSLVSGYQCMR